MQSQRSNQEINIPTATQNIQQMAMANLVLCLQSDAGSVHQEYCKNLCIENLRCSRSIGTSLRVLQNIINAHPITPPIQVIQQQTDDIKDKKNEETIKTSEELEKKEEISSFNRQSTRNEIITALEKHHGILTLFFQDLSRYMSSYSPNHNNSEHKEDINIDNKPHQIANFRARFDFLGFILQFSSLSLSSKQLEDLWNIIIGETLKEEYSIPYIYKLEQNYFFKWLKDTCPPLNIAMNINNIASAISINDAVSLFHSKLGSMPRKTMTSDSLQCLHQYFDLVYDLATKKSPIASSSSSSSSSSESTPDLSGALDVMWEIAIEAETDTVAQSCGVFILSFYMKPAIQQKINPNDGISNKVSDNILNLINSNATTTANQQSNGSSITSKAINRWEGRTNFIEKCVDYIQKQSISNNWRAVHRCLDLLETFIECTRPGVMNGQLAAKIDSSKNKNVINIDVDDNNKNNLYNRSSSSNMLTNVDFKKTSAWDLGIYAINYWKLPIGLNHFIKIHISNLQMQKDTKNFEIMINKHSRIGELQDLISAILNQDKNLLQMQSNTNVALTPQIASSTLESVGLRDGCSITVMSIFAIPNNSKDDDFVPDGAYILSQNVYYINDVLLELLSHTKGINVCNNQQQLLSTRIWNLLMRLPFNFNIVSSLKDITSNLQIDENNNTVLKNNSNDINWNELIADTSCTNLFQLLYNLQIIDYILQNCTSLWLDSFVILGGLDHLYSILLSWQFNSQDNVFLYASYRSLYMLFKIFASFTSHELINSDPLYSRCKPRHSTPLILNIRDVSGVLSKFTTNQLNVQLFGQKIFNLIAKILTDLEENNKKNIQKSNHLLAEIIDLSLYQFISLLFHFSNQLKPLFDERYRQKTNNNNQENAIIFSDIVIKLLFCSDKLIRSGCIKHLYQIFVKYNPDPSSSQHLHYTILELLYDKLESIKLNLNQHYVCIEYFKFYGLIIQYYISNALYFESTSYNKNLRYFKKKVLNTLWESLSAYRGLETTHADPTDEYLLGLLNLITIVFKTIPTLKHGLHCIKLIRSLKNELIYNCLFATPSHFSDNALNLLQSTRKPPIPKCHTLLSRQAAFNLLLEISNHNSYQIWNEILQDFQKIHDRRINIIGDNLKFGFNPSYSRRADNGLAGLNNYGCTCYMNATMQQLFMNPVIRKVILGVDLRKLYPISIIDNDNNNKLPSVDSTVFYAMQTMFANLKWSNRRAIWPEDFLANYRDFDGNKIDPNEQMDAHEFYSFLFDNLERELKGTLAEQLLQNEFCGKEINQVICQECGYCSETTSPIYAIKCGIKNHLTLEEALDHEFVRGEWLRGGNAYRCSKCDKKVTALKRSCFTSLSNTLLITLNRFEFNLETMLKVKMNTELKFPINLNMKKYTKEYLNYLDENKNNANNIPMNDNNEDYEYELVGVIVHSGMADIGHYYSFIRKQNENGTLDDWYDFNDDYVSKFDISNISDKCYGGNKLTYIRDNKSNQLQSRWIPKSNNAYILVYRKKSIKKKIENLQIDDQYLTLKNWKLETLKQNGGKPPIKNQNVNKQESTTAESSTPKIMEVTNNNNTIMTTPGGEDENGEEIAAGLSTKDEKPIIEEPEDDYEKDGDNTTKTPEPPQPPQPPQTPSHRGNRDAIQEADIIENTSNDINMDNDKENINKHSNADNDNVGGDSSDNNMVVVEVEEEEEQDDLESNNDNNDDIVKEEHHLTRIASNVHWANNRFTQKCQLFDINLQNFEWSFFHLQSNKYSTTLPYNRHKSNKIRSSIGSPRTKLILYYIFDILCKYECATKLPEKENENKNNWNETAQQKKERIARLSKETPLYKWCEFIKSLFSSDIQSAYQFLYIITHTVKKKWIRYLLESRIVLVRQCLVDVIIHCIKLLLHLERPLYQLKESNQLDYMKIKKINENTDDEDDSDNDDEEKQPPLPPLAPGGIGAAGGIAAATAAGLAAVGIITHGSGPPPPPPPPASSRHQPMISGAVNDFNRNKKDDRVPWFQSGSIIVHVLDEMCLNILRATHHWRKFNEFWLFFFLFSELGNPEKQLLLDRHLIIECYRFYNNRRPFEYGLKQLIKEESDSDFDIDQYQFNIDDDDDDDDKIVDPLFAHRIHYDRKKMGSNDSEPNVHNMIGMLSNILCSCRPLTMSSSSSSSSDYILPPTLNSTISSFENDNNFLLIPIVDKRIIADPKIWIKYLEDAQNSPELSNIICHLSWRNNEYSKKTCKYLFNYLEEYSDNVYPSAFNVLRSFLSLNDYREQQVENEDDDEDDDDDYSDDSDQNKMNIEESYELQIFTHLRIDKFLTPVIKMIKEWYRESKYTSSVAKIAQFIDEQVQTNILCAEYFRLNSNNANIIWFKQFLNQHPYYLNLPKPPEFN